MVCFFGIMLQISIERWKMGGYTSYFDENTTFSAENLYNIAMRGYAPWGTSVMSFVRFRQIKSAYHPELGENKLHSGHKYYLLRYSI